MKDCRETQLEDHFSNYDKCDLTLWKTRVVEAVLSENEVTEMECTGPLLHNQADPSLMIPICGLTAPRLAAVTRGTA